MTVWLKLVLMYFFDILGGCQATIFKNTMNERRADLVVKVYLSWPQPLLAHTQLH